MSGAGTTAATTVNMSTRATQVLLVTRCFWPLCDDSAGRLAMLAEGLRRSGFVPTIVTAKHSSAWPHEIEFREIEVLRPVAAPKSEWTTGLYFRNLTRWLREHTTRFDLLYADCMREEGAAVVETAEHFRVPSVVRCSGSGSGGDWVHAASSRTARKSFNVSMRATGLIASTAVVNRALISAGAARDSIHRIADGVPPVIRRERSDQLTARAALAAVNSDMRVPGNCRVILFNGRFSSEHAVMFAARALVPLCSGDRDVRLWFIGDGPQRDALHEFFLQMGVRSMVAMPGTFWHIEELIRAADIAVFPSDSDSLEHRLAQAVSGALPIVICDSNEMKSYFAELKEAHIILPTFHNNSEQSLRDAVSSILDAYDAAQRHAVELRNVMRRSVSREHSIDAHCRLFTKLIQENGGRSFGNTIDDVRGTQSSSLRSRGASKDETTGEKEAAS